MKSAYEIAMARLQAQDQKSGLPDHKPLTDEQKRKISELRQEAKAKKAELQILRNGRMAEVASDPAKLQEEEEHYRTDLRRIEAGLESKIAEVKSQRSS